MTPAILPPVEAAAKPEAPGTQSSGKLKKSAQEFESILLQSWLEKMNQIFVGSSESQDPAHDTVSSLGTQAIASAMAARGGIGIAAMLLRQLQPVDSPRSPQHREGVEALAKPTVRAPETGNFTASGTVLPKGASR